MSSNRLFMQEQPVPGRCSGSMRAGVWLAGLCAFLSVCTFVVDFRAIWQVAILEGFAGGLIVGLFRSGTPHERFHAVGPAAVFVGIALVLEIACGVAVLVQ